MKIRNFLLITLLMSLGLVFAGCDDDDDTNNDNPCGNGIVDPGEDCDGDATITIGCSDLVPTDKGELTCSAECTFVTDACEEAVCGDGVKDDNEECDGTDFGDATCESQGDFSGGTLGCTDLCTVDTTECVHACNVTGFFENCNAMGGDYECCPMNDMPSTCTTFWNDGQGRCMQTCGEDGDCGWNLYCEAQIQNHCYYNFCGDGNGEINTECSIGNRTGWCYPLWRAMDNAGLCFENGTQGNGEACVRDDNNPVDGTTGVDPSTQCENGICIPPTGQTDGTCINYCDPVAAYEGTDGCPANWNCFSYSDFDTEQYMEDGVTPNPYFLFREADYGVCYPMQDGLHDVLDTALVTCDLMTGLQIKDGAACPTGQLCKVGMRGSLMGICTEAEATPLAEGDDCTMPAAEGDLAPCEEGTYCYYAIPTSDVEADWDITQCIRICDANDADPDAACSDLTTADGTPYTCLSMSRYFTAGNVLPTDSSTTPPTVEASPSPLGYCVPPRAN